MIRFFLKLIICVLLAGAAGTAYLATRSGDPLYSFYEWISPARFQQYDPLIRAVAAEHHLDPMLLKAVVWRESRFDPQKFGSAGERGLMQVSEKAADEWARENKIENFHVEDLFDPKTNLEAGTWYLHRAVQHGKYSAIRFRLPWPNTTRAQAARNAGPAATIRLRFRRTLFIATSIFQARAGMSIQSSRVTSFTNGAAGCERWIKRRSRKFWKELPPFSS
jgi:soluble lytic murein transglycosylase-like protein